MKHNIIYKCLLVFTSIIFAVSVSAQSFTITKSVVGSSSSFQSGQTFQYKINIQYEGPSNPGELVITDDLPQGLIYLNAAVPAQWSASYSSGTVIITNTASIPTGFVGLAEFIITVKTDYGAIGNNCQFCNQAKLDYPSTGSIISNSVCVTITAQNKWTMTKEIAYYLGSNVIRYRIKVFHNGKYGNFDLVNFSFFDESEPGSTISYAPNLPGTIPGLVVSNIAPNQIKLDGTSTLHIEYGSYHLFYLDVAYPCPDFSVGDTVCNKVKLSADGPRKCPVTTNQASSTPDWDDYDFDESREKIELNYVTICDTMPTPVVVGSLSKTNLNRNHFPGCENIYTIIYTNWGNIPINNIEIIDDLPGEIEVFTVTEIFPGMVSNIEYYSAGSWSNSNPGFSSVSKLKWTTTSGYLLPLESVIIRIHYKNLNTNRYSGSPVNTGDIVTNTVSVDADGASVTNPPGCSGLPSYQLNLTDSHNFIIEEPEGLACLKKSVSNNYPNIGDIITYKMAIYNYGGGGLAGTITDNVPAGLNIIPGSFKYYFGNYNIMFSDNFCGNVDTGGALSTSVPSVITTSGPPIQISGQNISFDIDIPSLCEVDRVNKLVVSFDVKVTNIVPCNQYIPNKFYLDSQASNPAKIRLDCVSNIEFIKLVKGDMDATFGPIGNTQAGGSATYKIIVNNVGNTIIDHIDLYDKLPMISDTDVACSGSGTPRNSQFNVSFNSALSSSVTPLTVEYFNLAPTSGLSAFIGGSANYVGNNGIKIDFGNYQLGGGQSIIMTYDVAVPNSAIVGNSACNNITARAFNASSNTSLGCQVTNPVCLKINEFVVPCCKGTDMDVVGNNGNVTSTPLGNFTLATINPTIIGGTLPIQEVRVSIVDFKYINFSEADCQACYVEEDEAAIFWKSGPAPVIGNLTVVPTTYDREWILNNGITSLSTGQIVPFNILLPQKIGVSCCSGTVEVCVKFTVKNVNCETCTFIKCYSISI